MNPSSTSAPRRPGFSLIEVTLAVGIIGLSILALVGILGSTFQQVDDIMQTNRALAGVTKLVGALDNPRSIISMQASDNAAPPATTFATVKYIHQDIPALDPNSATFPASNFDLVYRLMAQAPKNQVWLYVYERKIVIATEDFSTAGSTVTYNLQSNPSVMEVVSAQALAGDEFSAFAASARNVVGVPMRVRLSVSKLLNGQRYKINDNTGEPDVTKWTAASTLDTDPAKYALAYLPLVAEFFPHDFSPASQFKNREETPLLVQNIIISR